MSDREDIIGIVRTLLGRGVTVTFDHEQPSCFWEYERSAMTLSNKVIPQVLIGTVAEPLLLTGASIHECGHPIYDARTLERRINKIRTVKNPQLMKDVMNIINDSGVNYRMQIEWGATVAQHLKFLILTMGRGMIADINADYTAGAPVDPITVMLAVGNFVAPLKEFEDVLKVLSTTQRKLVFEGIRCIKQSCTTSLWEDKAAFYDELYRIMTKLLASQNKGGGEGAGESMPTQMGGTYVIQGDSTTKAAAEKDAKAQGNGDGDAEGDDGSDGDSQDEEKESKSESGGKGSDQKTRSVGYDPSATVETPKPNINKYLKLVAKNQKHIKSILDRLKADVTITLRKDSYQRAGRMMGSMVTRAATMRYPPTNIYQRMRIEEEKEPTRWAITVDLSGSMNTAEAMDALIILAEAASHYLDDNQFSLYVFGDKTLKLKSFYEAYENIKARIGGLTNLGGTCLFDSIEMIEREFASFPNGHRNRIIIVSDFWLMGDDEPKSLALLKDFAESNPKNKVICLELDGTENSITKAFGHNRIKTVGELPDIFISAYIEDVKK